MPHVLCDAVRIRTMQRRRLSIAFASWLIVATVFGCQHVRRSITVTSDPAGALLTLNGREIGRTPVSVDFLHYGIYDVQLEAEGYEPLLTTGEAQPPLWDTIPLDLVSELTPPMKHAKIVWHYQLQPRDDDPAAVLERARQLRERLHGGVPPPVSTPAGANADESR